MYITIDIETIPDQREGALEAFQKDARENFSAPSDLTKERAAADLGLEDPQEIKFTSKAAMLERWVERFREEKSDEVAEQNWRKTSFDGGAGQLFCFGIAIYDDEPIVICDDSESETLRQAFMLLQSDLEYGRRPVLVGHNHTGFDLRFIYQRAIINGVAPPIWWPHNARPWDSEIVFDTMVQWAGIGGRIKLDALCKALGIEGKPDDIDGSKVWDFVKSGEHQKVCDYCADDVIKTREVYRRMTCTSM